MRYTKQLLTLQQQIDILKERGLLIENEEEAKNAFDTISYFRQIGSNTHSSQVPDSPR